MAAKGAKAELKAVVRQTYIETGNLTLAAETHGVSRQTATQWKNWDGDEWDKARERKASFGVRMEKLFDREMLYAEESKPGSIPPPTLNALNQLGAMVLKFKALEVTPGDSAPVDEAAAMEMLQSAMEKAKAMQTETDKGLVLEELVANLALQQTLQGLTTGSIQVALIPKILGEIGKLQVSSVNREKFKAEVRAEAAKKALAAAAAAAVTTLKKSKGASDKVIEQIRADILGVELPV